jgi:hypothetical protein
MTIEYFVTKFVNMMRYVPYLREEKEKVQWFMSCLPQAYKDKIEFINPNMMDEVIRHTKLCYNQFKQRYENTKTWKDKNKNNKFDPRKKEFKYPCHCLIVH